MNRPSFISTLDWELIKDMPNLDKVIEKINNGYPIQYIIGEVSFYGYPIKVNENVLIPRFETEGLIEKILERIDSKKTDIIDLCTGSGAIAIVLKKQLPESNISAIDISKEAINTAIINAKLNNADIDIKVADIFKYNPTVKYDLIVSNPPYIEKNSNFDPKILYEPEIAVFVDNDNPLIYYKRIFEIAVFALKPKGLLALEIDEDHSKDMQEEARKYFPKAKITIEKDLIGKDRYLFLINE